VHVALHLHHWQELRKAAIDSLNCVLLFLNQFETIHVLLSAKTLHQAARNDAIHSLRLVDHGIYSCNAAEVTDGHSILDIANKPAGATVQIVY